MKQGHALEKEKKTVVIYGKNGSGKSSLAQAVREYAQGHQQFTKVDLIDNNKNIIDKNSINSASVYVFNEAFIHEKIRFTADDKLNAIFLVGKNKDLDDEIEVLREQEIELTKNVIPELSKKESEFTDSKNVNSPFKYFDQVKNKLKSDWAKREEIIRGLKQAAPVSDEFVKSFMTKQAEEHDIGAIQVQYNIHLKKLQNASNSDEIKCDLTPITIKESIDEEIKVLLSEIIEKPQFSVKEQKIITLLENHQYAHLKENREQFLQDNTNDSCPFCMQPVLQAYKDDLSNSIKSIFETVSAQYHSQQLDQLTNQLKSYSLNDSSLECYAPLDEESIKILQGKIAQYNESIDEVRSYLLQKKNNIYKPITNFSASLKERKQSVNDIISKLEQLKNEFNNNIKDKRKLINELREINTNLAVLDISEYAESYQKQNKAYEQFKIGFQEKNNELTQLKTKIEMLIAEKLNIKLAIDLINHYLSYIFFSSSRLKIIPDGDKYSVLAREEKVLLKNLSEGEKNIIALCYFFSTILENKTERDYFKEECLIVLDDPISSFYFHNKIGIFSFLRHMIWCVHKENKNSRILILTHQIEAVFHLEKICSDTKINTKLWILENHILKDFSRKNHNEYSYLMNQVFDYANKSAGFELSDHSIGNTMRKVLECFGTFNYKLGCEGISCKEEVLQLIPDEAKQKHFRHLMYRLVLNTESHLEYQAQASPETDFFSFIEQDEKIRTAKELLIFLKLINKLHVESHLSDKKNLKIIEQWEDNIFPFNPEDLF